MALWYLLEKLKGILNTGVSEKLVLMFIKESLLQVSDDELEEMLDSLVMMTNEDIEEAFEILFTLVKGEGFVITLKHIGLRSGTRIEAR